MKAKRIWRGAVAVIAAATLLVTSSAALTAGVQALDDMSITTYAATSSVTINVAAGAEECAYAQWSPVTNATGYNVYYKKSGGSYVQVDSVLIRQYPDYFRVDVLGLAAGSYTLKIVPIINGVEDTSKQAESSSLTVESYDRTGFAFSGTDGSCGAYNADGTLKSDAIVLYLTQENKDTISLEIDTKKDGSETSTYTGIQYILDALKSNYESRPICIRVIGTITDPEYLASGDLLIDGNNSNTSGKALTGVTLEGVGEDATFDGFGIRLKNLSNAEIRNLGIMLVDSDEGDCIGLQQSNDHIWVHNCDYFYGEQNSDADQAKGDGALDCKKSTYVTFSYNHFWDSGKCNLLGLSEGTTEDLYITYHHNWYDHSDSRHPRVRYYSAHVYNNYYDGNAKYGIGACLGCSIFVENNYFRNCKYPMMISNQGCDTDETLSGEDGGMIKAYGNYMEGQKSFVSYAENNTDFDAYVASSRNETVSSSVKSKAGGNTYNNFDTSGVMYSYTADAAADVPAIVTAKAGRLNGGDFQWEFDNSTADESSSVDTGLKEALRAYTSSVVAIGSGFSDSTSSSGSSSSGSSTTTDDTVTDGDIFCSPTGTGSGSSENDPTSVETAVTSITAGHTIYLLAGTYSFSSPIIIKQGNDGTASAPKTMKPYNGASVVFDFSGESTADSNRGIVLDGDYWHIYGFEITKAGDNGMLLSGNNNTIERMIFSKCQDSGLQLSRYRSAAASIDEWPSNNLILNCTARNNCDDAMMEDADGFAAKLTCGEGNVFDGCLSYNNSDDGWDLYAKSDTGPIGAVTIRNCISARNGFTEDGDGYEDCDGNGFKLGGGGIEGAHVVENCLAIENLNCGFTDNNNPGLASLTNCTAINNNGGGNGKTNFSCYRCTACDFTNILSYYDSSAYISNSKLSLVMNTDRFVGTFTNGILYNSGSYYLVENTVATTDKEKIGVKFDGPASSDFISTSKLPSMGTDLDAAWRDSDGSLNPSGIFETAASSAYYTMGYHMTNGDSTSSGSSAGSDSGSSSGSGSGSGSGSTSGNVTAGDRIHNFTENGLESTFYTISGNLSTSKGTVYYNGLTLTQCLKMETATSITFTTTASGSITLVFLESAANIYIDGVKYTAEDEDGIITVDLTAGNHTITKADTANLYYMCYADDGATSSGDGSTSGSVNAGDRIHNFTENGLESTFYTISGNLSTSKGTVYYNGLTLTQCLKMETATSITFTTTASGSITLVFLESAANIYIDGVKYTAEDEDGIITVDLTAGNHTITKADTANLYYMVYADSDGSSSVTTTTTATATTTTTTTTVTLAEGTPLTGDANCDLTIDLGDVVLTARYYIGTVTLTEQGILNADVYVDGQVNALDEQYLLQFVLHAIDTLPINP